MKDECIRRADPSVARQGRAQLLLDDFGGRPIARCRSGSDTRSTWRSTGNPGTPSAWPSTTLAVLRRRPRQLEERVMSAVQTTPPCWLTTRALAAPMSALDFARKKPVEWICRSRADTACARRELVGGGYPA